MVHYVLQVLDIELTAYPSGRCEDDWLEHTTDPLAWNKGIKLCGGLRKGDLLDTGKREIYLNFNSDGKREHRGFWLQYGGKEKYF